ncbi:type IVB secretion system protein IcmH/DotU [Variovorax sp.]|uniref:type IVB secretion system protein IcmH/DotU n=1 Tax=Variovorax sp. TaxID=1871043 RepID=UPI002D6352AC|nr:type IVB secretion system protein IcmH/DotU [Variovorax sp.]HYP86480.1 type IVB secretion system protein IcmH/DotU [Variovorax sp.]
MSFFNNMSEVLRRATGANVSSPQAALNRLPGTSGAVTQLDSVLGSARAMSGGGQLEGQQQQTSLVEDAIDKQGGGDAGAGALWQDDGPRRPAIGRGLTPARPAILRPGRSESRWANPFIDVAMPVLLRLEQLRSLKQLHEPAARAQLSLEIKLFRDRLARSDVGSEPTADASYLLCAYVDEVVNDAAREASVAPYGGEPSLLVEFHGDAWGGEDAFVDLERWMRASPPQLAILEFYELILSFGWRGRYRIIERGEVLLGDLRSELHGMIWREQKLGWLSAPVLEVAPVQRRRRFGPALFLAVSGLVLAAMYAWLVLDLDSRGRPIREALAAWDPPVKTINLAETLPPPLPGLLSEGWVAAQKDPQGWRLAFKSDGAFAVGKANFRPEFKPQIDRLGLAFAPWPGDIEVIGHSDSRPMRGSREFPDNMALSQERARVVAEELKHTAVAGGSRAPANALSRDIGYSGRGATEPVDPARTAAAYERNRRVEVLWRVRDIEPQTPRTVAR